MRKFATYFVALFVLLPSSFGQATNLGEGIGDLPDALLWHFKVFVLLPANLKDFSKAVEIERARLKPGEEKEFDILMRYVGPDPIRFTGLVEKGAPVLRPGDVHPAGTIRLQRARFVSRSPLEPINAASWAQLQKQLPPLATIEHQDHKFAVKVLSSQEHKAGAGGFVDLLSTKIVSPANGTVILQAASLDQNYEVYDVATKKRTAHRKGARLKEFGGVLYVLLSDSGKDYVVVFSNLAETKLQAGDKVSAGQLLGESRDPLVSRGGIQTWRVNAPTQYFLRNGAVKIFPLP